MLLFLKTLSTWALCSLFAFSQTNKAADKNLFYAIFDGDYAAIEKALRTGADVNASYHAERYAAECIAWTPVHAAAAMNNVKALKLLKSKGANLRAILSEEADITQEKFTALHIAAGYGSVAAAEYLIAEGLEVDAKAEWNRTPLVRAIRSLDKNNIEVVRLLVENGADINLKHSEDATPLFDAASGGRYEIAELLLEKGANPNALSSACAPNSLYKVTPIFCAIWQHKNHLLPLLQAHGALLNTPELSSSPLHQAVASNNIEAATFLIANGANRDMKDSDGYLPLDIAKSKNNPSMIYLVENGKLSDTDRKKGELFKSDAFKSVSIHPYTAPNFQFTDLDGNLVSSNSLAGKVIILNVWATWCGPCLREMPSFKSLLEKVNSKDIVLVAISIDQKLQAVKDFAANNSYPFSFLHDPEAKVRELFGAAVPATFIIDKKGNVQANVDGSIDWDKKEFKTYLDLLLKE